jgi:hypothetical protein
MATSSRTELFARESIRRFEPGTLRLKLKGDPSVLAPLRATLTSTGGLELVSENPQLVLAAESNRVHIQDLTGAVVGGFELSDAATAAKSLASYHSLLRLRDAGAPAAVDVSFQKVECATSTCVNPSVLGAAEPDPGGEYIFSPGQCFRPVLKNSGTKKQYAYLLHLSSDFGVGLVQPAESDLDEADAPLEPRKSLVVPETFCMNDSPGTDHFMLIATDNPIDAAVLQQDALRITRGKRDPLSQLLGDARHTTRSTEATNVEVGGWGVLIRSAVTKTQEKGVSQ